MRKQFSNQEILSYAKQLKEVFINNNSDLELPIRVNFYLQKNIKTILSAAQEIDTMRLKIGQKYGAFDKQTNGYQITDAEQLERAQIDVNNLLSIDQVLNIHMVTLSELEDIKLTVAQMSAILFMVEEDDDSDPEIVYIDEE